MNREGIQLVSARELHEFLEVKTRFDNWMKRMIEYGFTESKDYETTNIAIRNSKGGKQSKIDYAITLDMAKEISMIQRSPKGKDAREYFIECEKLLRLSEDKRLEAYEKLKVTESKFKDTCLSRNVDDDGFEQILEKGNEALFNVEQKKIPTDEEMQTILIKSKDLATAITDHNTKEKDLIGKEAIENEHANTNLTIRNTLEENNIKPEQLKKESKLKRLK